MYTAKYDAKQAKELPTFQFHAWMYASALKYRVPGLCEAAYKALKDQAYPETLCSKASLYFGKQPAFLDPEDDFFEAAVIVYDNTIDEQDQMRKLIVGLARRKMMKLGGYSGEKKLRAWITRIAQIPELSADLTLSTMDSLLWLDDHAEFFVQLACPNEDHCPATMLMHPEKHKKNLKDPSLIECPNCYWEAPLEHWRVCPELPELGDEAELALTRGTTLDDTTHMSSDVVYPNAAEA